MKNLNRTLIILVLLLGLSTPVFAQDDNSLPDATPVEDVAPTEAIAVEAPVPAPVAADESAEAAGFTQMAYLVIIVVQFLVIALLAWRIAGSVPPELITLMFDTAANVARLTPSTSDDQRITELRDLVTRYLIPAQAVQRASPAGGDKTTVNVFTDDTSVAPIEG